MLILRSLFFKNSQSGRYIHQCAPTAPDWSSLFLCIYKRRAFLRQTFLLHRNYRIHCCRLWPSVHVRKLGCFTGRLVCQKDNGCPLLMYHLSSEIHQPGIPGVGDKTAASPFSDHWQNQTCSVHDFRNYIHEEVSV